MEQSSPKPLPRRLRFEILRRDDHTCRYCGASAPDVKLTVDHVVPVALGGKHEPANLVTACRDCNSGKASASPDEAVVESVAQDAVRWADAMKRAADVVRQRNAEGSPYVAAVNEAWLEYERHGGDELPRPAPWEHTVRAWQAAGLPLETAVESVHAAMNARQVSVSNVWRYYCGICWRRLTELQEAARELLEGGN